MEGNVFSWRRRVSASLQQWKTVNGQYNGVSSALDNKLQIYKGIFYFFVTNTVIFAVFFHEEANKKEEANQSSSMQVVLRLYSRTFRDNVAAGAARERVSSPDCDIC